MGEAVFGQAKGQDEILAENFTRRMGACFFMACRDSMVVNDFDIMRPISFPAEADTPLIVDTDGVLAFAVAFERAG